MPFVAFCLRHFSADFIICTCEFEFRQVQGHGINRKRVQRLMRVMGIEALVPRPGTSKAAPGHKIYPYLLRGVSITEPNHVWASDITYIPMAVCTENLNPAFRSLGRTFFREEPWGKRI